MAPTPTNPEEHEPARLESLAETQNSKTALKYPKRPPQLHGISELVNSLNILSAPDFYAVLDVEPTADSSTIRDQYNKLSSLFHLDNNRASSREAFRLVTDAFGVLSDKTLRQNYDGKVDLEIRENMRTFWTACCTCRVLHQFERRYLGHKLVCPGCNRSFKAVEAVENDGSGEEEDNTLGEFMLKSIKRKQNEKMGCEKGESFKNNRKMGSEKGFEKGESFKGNGEVSGEKGVSFKSNDEVGCYW